MTNCRCMSLGTYARATVCIVGSSVQPSNGVTWKKQRTHEPTRVLSVRSEQGEVVKRTDGWTI